MRRSRTRLWKAKPAWLAAVMLLLALAGWHYWTLYSSLTSAREEFVAAAALIDDVGFDVDRGRVELLSLHIESASTAVDRADRHYHWDPLLALARVVPGAGGQVSAAGDFIRMGQIVAAIGEESVVVSRSALDIRDAEDGERLSESLARLLIDSGPSIERIDALAAELLSVRMSVGDRALVGPLDDARTRLDEQLPDLVKAVERGVQVQALLPALLGFEGERRYLVLALNNGELMPGGGLVTAGGVVTMLEGSNGPIDMTDSTGWKRSWEAMGGSYIQPPGPLQRYLLRDYTWNLLVSNWSPDFPTWAQQALEFYELVHGPQKVDGVIAADLVVLERLLRITGPKTLEAGEHGAITVDSSNAVIELERLTRQPFDESGDRKSIIGDLAEELVGDIQHLPSEKWQALVDIFRALGAERHIQMFSFHASEQGVIRDMGWSGHMLSPDSDYVHFNEGSVNSTKLNLIIAPEATYRVEIDSLGDARHSLELLYRNTLPQWQEGKDPRLVKQLMLGGLYGGYLRVFGPDSMTGIKAWLNGAPTGLEDEGREKGKTWAGVFMPLAPGTEARVGFAWSIPLATRRADSYELYIQKQPGTSGMCIDFAVSKEGVPATRVEFTGGKMLDDGRVCLVSDISIRAVFP